MHMNHLPPTKAHTFESIYITAPIVFPLVSADPTHNAAFVMCCCEVQHIRPTKKGMFGLGEAQIRLFP